MAYYSAAKIPRRLIFDPRGIIRRPGAVIARSTAVFEVAIDALADGDVAEVVYATPIESVKRAAFPAFTREAKRFVLEYPSLPIAIVVDELSFVCDRSHLDDDLEWLLKTGNPDLVHIFLTCHRPSDVPVDARAIADYWYIFQTTQEHDLDVIKARCRVDTADRVMGLRDHDFLLWDDARGSAHEFRDPGEWYVRLVEGKAVEWPDLADRSSAAAVSV